jgi:hypothetical protein
LGARRRGALPWPRSGALPRPLPRALLPPRRGRGCRSSSRATRRRSVGSLLFCRTPLGCVVLLVFRQDWQRYAGGSRRWLRGSGLRTMTAVMRTAGSG